MDEVLKLVFQRLELSDNLQFSGDEVKEWPPGLLEILQAAGLLQEIMPAAFVECPGCEEQCVEEVVVEDGRGFIYCGMRDDIGRVEVFLERLRQWQVNPEMTARWLQRELEAAGNLQELPSTNGWYLGHFLLQGRRCDSFLILQNKKESLPDDIERFWECSSPILFFPDSIPIISSALPPVTRLFSLSRLLIIETDNLKLDHREIQTVLSGVKRKSTREIKKIAVPPGVKWEKIYLRFFSGDMVQIAIGEYRASFHFTELGFQDKRKKDRPGILWTTLKAFAMKHGAIAWESDLKVTNAENKVRKQLPKHIQRLRRQLQELFSLDEDPFYAYTKEDGYRLKIKIEDASYSN